ncbi:MAG: ABC transporter permease [Bacillota bacterium]
MSRVKDSIEKLKGSGSWLALMGNLLKNYGIIIAFIIFFVILSFLSPAFLTLRNLHNIVDQSVGVGIIACAMTLAIISGNFDLSAGAIYAFSGSLAAIIAANGHVGLGFAIALLAGFSLGLLNGVIISGLRVHSFIATLATGLIIQGLALLMTNGRLIIVKNPEFVVIGQGSFLGIKYPIFIFAAWIAFTWILLSKTRFGRAVYAIGGNSEAARLSGIRVDWVRIMVFGLTGLSAALAGIIAVSRISQGQADMGSMIELQAIARVVIGGTSIMGGEGSVWGTVFGVLLMRLIGNGFNILNISPFYQRVFEGAVILFAVALDNIMRQRRR